MNSPYPPTPPEARRITPDCHGLDTPQRVCFYEQDFYVLSNFSAFTLQWRGRCFDTSEAVYHWEKFSYGSDVPGENEQQRRIRVAPSAHDAFKLADASKHLRRHDWDAVKVGIMREILRAKANQHEYVRRKLLATGDRELVENSWRDDFWGWGPNRDGQNILGKLWMEIRADIRAANAIEGIWPAAPTQPPAPERCDPRIGRLTREEAEQLAQFAKSIGAADSMPFWMAKEITDKTAPAPLAGGTAVQPSTAPAEVAACHMPLLDAISLAEKLAALGEPPKDCPACVPALLSIYAAYRRAQERGELMVARAVAAGCKEGRPVSPACLGCDESDRGQPYLETPALPSDPATGGREAELREALADTINIYCGGGFETTEIDPTYLDALLALLDRREGALRRELDNVQEALTPLVQLVEIHTLESDESFETEDVLESHYAELVKLRAEREQWRLSSVCREKEAELAALRTLVAKKDEALRLALGAFQNNNAIDWSELELALAFTPASVADELAAKDAEIARLKADNLQLHKMFARWTTDA